MFLDLHERSKSAQEPYRATRTRCFGRIQDVAEKRIKLGASNFNSTWGDKAQKPVRLLTAPFFTVPRSSPIGTNTLPCIDRRYRAVHIVVNTLCPLPLTALLLPLAGAALFLALS